MPNINNAYINALLADATYALDGETSDETTGDALKAKLNTRLTSTLAEYIANNFTVVTHIESSDVIDSGFDATVWRDNRTVETYVSMRIKGTDLFFR